MQSDGAVGSLPAVTRSREVRQNQLISTLCYPERERSPKRVVSSSGYVDVYVYEHVHVAVPGDYKS